jgi:uncharacterized paraquat-inducible protein A
MSLATQRMPQEQLVHDLLTSLREHAWDVNTQGVRFCRCCRLPEDRDQAAHHGECPLAALTARAEDYLRQAAATRQLVASLMG